MTHAEVSTMINGINLPYAYYQFPNDTPQAPPFICFFYSDNNDFLADDTNYQKIEHLTVELYTDQKDFTLENTVESALTGAGLVFTRNETFLDSERMVMVIYEADVVITEPATETAETEEQNGEN